jgi:hypothetical protein
MLCASPQVLFGTNRIYRAFFAKKNMARLAVFCKFRGTGSWLIQSIHYRSNGPIKQFSGFHCMPVCIGYFLHAASMRAQLLRIGKILNEVKCGLVWQIGRKKWQEILNEVKLIWNNTNIEGKKLDSFCNKLKTILTEYTWSLVYLRCWYMTKNAYLKEVNKFRQWAHGTYTSWELYQWWSGVNWAFNIRFTE